MNILQLVNLNQKGRFSAPPTSFLTRVELRIPKDTFEKTKSTREIYMEEFEELFPKAIFDKFYKKLNQDFDIDYPPRINFNFSQNAKFSGYEFRENRINFNLCEILDKKYKIISQDGDRRKTFISSLNKMPIFLTEEEKQEVLTAKKINSSYKIVPLKKSEKRKYVVHKLTQDIICAQQYMFMRKCENIGAKGALEANIQSSCIHSKEQMNRYVDYLLETTFWAKKETKKDISKGTPIANQALIWLDSIQRKEKYGASKMDMFNRSYNYMLEKFGEY